MPTHYCIKCNTPITPETNSEEHLFQNSIGGMLTVPGVLHRDCNNEAGNSWDAALAQQMNPLCLFLGIVRDRGDSPPLRVTTTAGENLKLHAGGGLSLANPSFAVVETDKGPAISLHARDKAEARRMLEGAKRKRFPNLDIDKILRTFDVETSYPQGAIMLSFSFGGREAGPAMVKTALTFAHVVGIDTRACDLGLSYLRDQTTPAPFGYFDDQDLVRNRQAGQPIHAVAVTADPVSGTLQAYVEYFGVVRIVVGLSNSYDGPAIHHSYGVDPLTGLEIGADVEPLAFTAAELEAIYRYERTSPEAQTRNFSPILDTAMKRQFEKEKNRAVADAVGFAFRNCGAKEGDILTPEQVRKLGGLVAHRLQPFLLRHMVRPHSRLPISPAF